MSYHEGEVSNDKMDRVFRTLQLHPRYSDAFRAVHGAIVTGQGPLPQVDRHYIALMACARHFCHDLLEVHEEALKSCHLRDGELLMKPKLRRLDRINKLLAHRPWMIKEHHIKDLFDGENGTSKWMLNELVSAVVILCHFHAFSAFVLGCGNLNDDDGLCSVLADNNGHECDDKVPNILKRMEDLQCHVEELEMTELARRFETVKAEQSLSHFSAKTKACEIVEPAKYSDQLDFQYVDFIKRDNHAEHPTFREREFSWADHAFFILCRFKGEELSKLVDEKFSLINDLTYMTIGQFESVDTRLFRMAVQRYVQCLFGIRHDDYDYGQINILLPMALKKYIKTLCCYPERCTKDEYDAIMGDFRNSEKVHVCLLVCEARFQAELLYGLRAVSDYYDQD